MPQVGLATALQFGYRLPATFTAPHPALQPPPPPPSSLARPRPGQRLRARCRSAPWRKPRAGRGRRAGAARPRVAERIGGARWSGRDAATERQARRNGREGRSCFRQPSCRRLLETAGAVAAAVASGRATGSSPAAPELTGCGVDAVAAAVPAWSLLVSALPGRALDAK